MRLDHIIDSVSDKCFSKSRVLLSARKDYLKVNNSGNLPGGHSGEEIPVPIPNTEVKLSNADDTAAKWESR